MVKAIRVVKDTVFLLRKALAEGTNLRVGEREKKKERTEHEGDASTGPMIY